MGVTALGAREKSLIAVAALALALALFFLLGSGTFAWHGIQVRVEPFVSLTGLTEIKLPPVGAIQARTHAAPLGIRLTLDEVDITRLSEMLKNKALDRDLLTQEAVAAAREFLTGHLARLLALGALGGALGALFIRRASWRAGLAGGLAGGLAVLSLLGATYLSFAPQSFQQAQYRGGLAAAPWVISSIERALQDTGKLKRQVEALAYNMAVLNNRLNRVSPEPAASPAPVKQLKVLHISDLHLNPAGFDIVESVTRTFGVDLIIDTGDISDYGTPLEAQFADRIGAIGVPYLYAAGNHDSPEILQAIAKLKNAKLLQGQPVQVKGLTVLGFPDPMSASREVAPLGGAGLNPYLERMDSALAAAGRVDILAVHAPALALPFAGRAPLILHGHDHRFSLREIRGSVVSDAGTTGAAGLRSLITAEKAPYTLVLFTLASSGQGWRVQSADTIRLADLEGSFQLERRIYNQAQVENSSQQKEDQGAAGSNK